MHPFGIRSTKTAIYEAKLALMIGNTIICKVESLWFKSVNISPDQRKLDTIDHKHALSMLIHLNHASYHTHSLEFKTRQHT